MVSSSVLALKTRHFPKNYNESKYIAITLYVTCVAWTLFIPGYFFFFFCIIWENGIMEGILDLNCIRFNWIHTLLGLFGPKLKLLLFNSKEELDPKSDESQNLSFFILPAIFTRLME